MCHSHDGRTCDTTRSQQVPSGIDVEEARSHFAINGAGAIHDYEFALIGATTESVARYICEGQFGLWTENGRINIDAKNGVTEGLGLGEAIGKTIEIEKFSYRDTSLLAGGYRNQVPL